MRVLCVVPRYGDNVLGGAEALIRGFAERAPALGCETHILTTCAADTISWANVEPRGLARLNGVPVWRYPLEPVHSPARQQALHYKLMTHQPLDAGEQYEWLENGPHSPALYAHLQRYADRYDAILLAPYLFPLIHYAAAITQPRSVIWPCLHDEAFMRFESTGLMLSQARGVIFNSPPEAELARQHFGELAHAVVAGVGVVDIPGSASRFRARYHLDEPFILYAGRLEPPKNVPALFENFLAWKRDRNRPLKLVLMGEGTLAIPRHPDILAIGFQDEQGKRDAFAAATILCQPSLLESFSIVVMEGWLAGVPALVHAHCPVTSYYCGQTGGGLSFSDEEEFIACVDWTLAHPDERARMGQQGRRYVQREFNWEAVIGRVLSALDGWLKERAGTP
jgi:glycosyltransferase involved in cell wall biosynthesis